MEVARVLRKKVCVTAAKLRILKCLGLPQEDMQWFTLNEQESQIHVVPMWTLASFKRLKHVTNQYTVRVSQPLLKMYYKFDAYIWMTFLFFYALCTHVCVSTYVYIIHMYYVK